MRLTKKEAQKIANSYKLGKIRRVTYLSSGWVNWNFKLETSSEKYVIQILGGREFDEWKKNKMKLQFEVLDYLSKRNFPYEIPLPIKNKSRRYLMKFKNRQLWIYKYIEGEQKGRLDKKEFQEIAKLTATYYKYMKDFKRKRDNGFYNFNWIFSQYKKLSKKKPKNKLDKLFVENAEFFINVLKKTQKVNYGKTIITHSDFNDANVLFKGNKVVGVIDFDNVSEAPKVQDIMISLLQTNYIRRRWENEKEKIFFREYEKILPLSKKEKSLIFPLLLKYEAILFWWFYTGMEKNRNKAYSSMMESLRETKRILKLWEKTK